MSKYRSNRVRTKLEKCLDLLDMLPIPLFPTEIDVLKIASKVSCHRMTVYRARNELKMRHKLLYCETNITDQKYENLKDITMRSVNMELKDHLKFMYNYYIRIMAHGEQPTGYDTQRLGVIEGYIGIQKEEE